MDATERWLGGQVQGRRPRRQHPNAARRSRLRRGRRSSSRLPSWSPPRRSNPARTATSPATRPWRGGIVAAGVQMERDVFLGAYPITPATRRPPRSRPLSTLRRQDAASRGRDRGGLGDDRRGLRRTARRHVLQRAGFRAETGSPGPGRHGRAPAGRDQRAARGTFDRFADEDGTGRPARRPLFGRHSQSPLPILAPSTPGDCFHTILEAFRMAVRYMTPVIVLSDGYLANSAGALADSRRRCPRAATRRVRLGDRPGRVPTLPARSADAGAALGDPGQRRDSNIASAGSPSRT